MTLTFLRECHCETVAKFIVLAVVTDGDKLDWAALWRNAHHSLFQ